MTNKIMFATDYVGIVTVGLYYTNRQPEFSTYYTSPDIEVGILTASNIGVSNTITSTDVYVTGIVSASQFIGTIAGTATTALSLSDGININVGVVTATGGFISSTTTTPIKINVIGNKIIFSVSGIGSTSLTLF